jgi:hypothetical protein
MRLTSLTLAAVALLTAGSATVFAASSSSGAAARAEHQRIVNYWTADRMAAAKPRDFVRNAHGFVPAAKPNRPGGGSTVTGASWTKGGDVVDAVGKVYFHMGGGDWQCSGSVANDGRANYSLVLTAGHCAVDETTGEFATNWMFMPSWDRQPATFTTACSNSLYGCWTAQALVAHRQFATAGSFNDQATRYDFAFAVVGAGGKDNSQLDSKVNEFGIAFNAVSNGQRMYAFGFPAAGKYHGNDLTYCAGNIIQDSMNGNATWGLGCDMTGGSSGGPWFANFSEATGSGTLGSLNSYGYSGIRNMYGPKFNSNTQAVYNAANGATSNTLVN